MGIALEPVSDFRVDDARPPQAETISLKMVVESPENVLLSYQLAGPAARCLAYGLDSIIRGLILGLVLVLAILTSKVLPGVTWGLVLILMFALEWGYHIVSEGFFRGKTIGKDAMGLRVVQLEGYPLSFWSAVQRNLMRVVDGVPLIAFLALTSNSPREMLSVSPNFGDLWGMFLMMPIYGPALCAMLLSRRFQRLGDLVAGTVVISERRSRFTHEAIIISKIHPLSAEEIGPHRPSEETLVLIDEFLSRREELTHERGHELCADFAVALAERLEFQGDAYQLQEYPMSFLARVYVSFARTDGGAAAFDPFNGNALAGAIDVADSIDHRKEPVT